VTKLQPLKPYAKLKDCVGQRLVAAVVPQSGSSRLDALLVFDGAWARFEVYGYDGDDGPTTVLRERAADISGAAQLADTEYGRKTLEEFARLGLLDSETVAKAVADAKAEGHARAEQYERREYERLKKKFEGEP
jgi:hypothetical protein